MKKQIHVAGDVCLDVLGLSMPAPLPSPGGQDNWRETGETRTHYRLGGALLLADLVAAAMPECEVKGPRPCLPDDLLVGKSKEYPLSPKEFLDAAERFTRKEIVHSLLRLDHFRAKPGAKDADTIRVKSTEGFSGPSLHDGEPSLKILPPDGAGEAPDVIVLDDTGNRFRRSPDQWPAVVMKPLPDKSLLAVHKLHRPLPGKNSRPDQSKSESGNNSSLWEALTSPAACHIVIVSVEDLRECEAPISRGLSWERTALDLVWQLLNVENFEALRSCPHLIVRLGLDGAVYWRYTKGKENDEYRAWLIYNPSGIEGSSENACEGKMVAYGSAFTAALVKDLVAGTVSGGFDCYADKEGKSWPGIEIEKGIKSGLLASQRLLQMGFGSDANEPNYPREKLFGARDRSETLFACQPIPIIPGAANPDRGYWRLLESIFSGKTQSLHRAVALMARNAKPATAEDTEAANLLAQSPVAVFAKALRTYDRREIENYRALYSLMHDYVRQTSPLRPLSVAVFGPPGAGKSFGVKKVAEALVEAGGLRKIKPLTFNLSQYHEPDELAAAFHLVRDIVLRGEIPLVFFDEFDTALDGQALGWLRYFLSPMQDAEFMDRGTPHPIGQSIFVFAGGTCNTYEEFARPFTVRNRSDESSQAFAEFKSTKGPDFLSRLRGSLNIPGLDLNADFDAYGPPDAFPCDSAILLRRAGILAFQLSEKSPHLRNADKSLKVSPPVIRALLHLPRFEHGNRSFEALLDMSHLVDEKKFTPALLPASGHTELHAAATHLSQLIATEYPFPPTEREKIAQAIHRKYIEQRKQGSKCNPDDPSLKEWNELAEALKESNREQADHIAVKLRAAGLWFRKIIPGTPISPDLKERLETMLEELAKSEHDRWVAEKRRQGWISAASTARESRNDLFFLHNCIFRWEQLTDEIRDLDRVPVRNIPGFLAEAGYELFAP